MESTKMIISPLTRGDKQMLKRGLSKKIYVVGFGHNNYLGHWVYKDKKFIFKINRNFKYQCK
tara:strand:+ start:278 stop:463 length:186 start_codon:yes stop_codon:yes gene_type:complete